MRYGYHGKSLYVDLTKRQFREEKQNENFYRRYPGGSVMATVKMLQETKQGLDAFDPESYLMFYSGIVSGMPAPGLARFVICGKSPSTGGIGEARCEGPFAVALKKTGFDGLIIHGACQTPSILVIEDGVGRLESAEDLWGKTIGECEKVLQKTYRGASNAVIGPAGENLVRFANVVCDKNHQASRAGMGAVMGSKLLKAVVLLGGSLPAAYNPEELEKTNTWFVEKMQKNVLSMWQHDRPGFGAWIHTHGIDAALCVNNYQTSICEYTEEYTPEKFAKFYRGEANCPFCPNNCIKRYATDGDDEMLGGLHQEALASLGPNLGNSDLEKIITANVMCNEYGMDPNSLGFSISFAQECVQKGLLDGGGLNLSFSPEVDLVKIIEKIARRQGLGDLLAEGAYRAAKTIGKGADKFAMTVKKTEMTSTEPRSQTNLALGYATAAVGPRYDICEHDWDFDVNVGWEHSLEYCRTLGILDRIPMQYLGEDKVKDFKALNNLWAAVDALGMCLFATAPTRVYSLEDIAKLYHDITGFETSSYEIMRLGEMKNQVFRLYNYREGLGPEDDILPQRFFDNAIDAGTLKGNKLDKNKFQQIVRFYYSMMGWDENGRPNKATLYDLGLDWASEILDT
ncbi:MAG: aldehyde ferredoxin oxidoreductase C-terminal domain-containing protein [Sphaerochaetaceae bacterium]|nr:aldehyde ferredoxin oxidoreductase C-terminal domain-containing protein [Sphaerochaetaceae bacterium]